MISNIFRGAIYFLVFVSIQVLFLNNIHFFHVATPFLYLYFLIKLPVGLSRAHVLILSFLTGLTIDAFSNTPGMHAAACTLVGFARDPLILIFMGKDLPEGMIPSFRGFGPAGFLRYLVTFVLIHHITLFLIESFMLFNPLLLTLHILSSSLMTIILICAVEAFNLGRQKSGE